MNLKIHLVIVLLFLGSSAFTQKMYLLSLDGTDIDVPKAEIYVESILDERRDKASVGWVQTGIMNKKRYANFVTSLDEEVYTVLSKSLITSDNKTPIRIGVTHLHISERTEAMSEYATAEVELVFYAQNQEGLWVVVGKTSANNQEKGMDVTKKHPQNITMALEKAIQGFLESPWKENVNNSEYTLSSTKFNLSTVPIYTTSDYEAGIYSTFEEFSNNQPTIVENFEVRSDNGKKVKLWVIDKNGKRKSAKNHEYYGFAYAGKLYKKYEGGYFEIEKKDDGLYFIGPRTADNDAVTAGAVTGGLIGGAIASAATTKQMLYRIDLESGIVIEVGPATKKNSK